MDNTIHLRDRHHVQIAIYELIQPGRCALSQFMMTKEEEIIAYVRTYDMQGQSQ